MNRGCVVCWPVSNADASQSSLQCNTDHAYTPQTYLTSSFTACWFVGCLLPVHIKNAHPGDEHSKMPSTVEIARELYTDNVLAQTGSDRHTVLIPSVTEMQAHAFQG